MGRVSAKMMAAEGAKVVAAGRRQDKGEELVREITEAGNEAVFVRTDVTVDADCDALVAAALEKYGRIDVLFNNAGAGKMFHFEDMDWEKNYDAVMDLNLRADYYLSKAVIPFFMKQKKGDFLYTCSIAATEGSIYLPTYASAKAGVVQLAKSLALEFGKYGIRANCILPGPIRSEMNMPGGPVEKMFLPMLAAGRIGDPEEIANTAIFLASDEARFITGTTIVVDGGLTAGMYKFPD